MQVPITKAYFDECEKELIQKPLESGWVVQGPFVAQFEELFKEHVGSKYAHATTSCTTALHLGLEAMGIGRGDKVVVPSFTYIASANAVEYTGAEVVFCDIDLRTFNIDVKELEDKVSTDSSIKAVMPVHLFGLCANMPEVMKIAEKYNLKVIEDSACGFDAWIGDKHSGTFGDVGCFSFHPRKPITTGEGGMLITDNGDISAKVLQLRDHGASKTDLQRHKEGGSLLPDFKMRGFNYRMTDLQGALGVCQMKKADLIMKRRREIAKMYDEAINSDPVLKENLITPYVPEGYVHSYQSYVCIFSAGEDIDELNMEKVNRINVKRNEFMKKLEEKGIATRQGTHAVHTLSYYKDKYSLKDEDFLNSYAADRLSIALPLYPTMSQEEFEYVIDTMRSLLK